MKKILLDDNDLKENNFWHITSRRNYKSIEKNGLVPHDGKRNGVNISPEDPIPRVFFSQGIRGVLEQANNLPRIVNEFLQQVERRKNGSDGRNIAQKMETFFQESANNDTINKKEEKNGGFIDIMNFLKNDIFKEGVNENLSKEEIETIVYSIVTNIWKNYICIKGNLEEGIDYSWDDTNFTSSGKEKSSMTKRNMHTFEGKTIESKKLDIITDKNGNPKSTWDVLKEMAVYYKKEFPDKKTLPVPEEKSGYINEKNEIVYTGKIIYGVDYLSKFIEMEKEEKGLKDEKSKKRIKSLIEKNIKKSELIEIEEITKTEEELKKGNNIDIEKN